MKVSNGNLGFCLAASFGTIVLVAASVHAEHAKRLHWPMFRRKPDRRSNRPTICRVPSARLPISYCRRSSRLKTDRLLRGSPVTKPRRRAVNPRDQSVSREHRLRTCFPIFQSPPMNTPGGGMPAPRGGIGSGVIIDESGIMLTNNHVVAGDGEITVRTHDGREFVASNVWTDPKTDLAVVKIEDASDLVAATLGDSEQVEIGDWVMALGQPFGLESTVTAGIISAKHRGIGITARENFLQTDAAINPGNSGGPLVNLRGEVVGINTAIHSRSGGNDGIGFAIPSNLARWVSDQLVSTGTVKRAYLGVGIQPVTQDLAKQLVRQATRRCGRDRRLSRHASREGRPPVGRRDRSLWRQVGRQLRKLCSWRSNDRRSAQRLTIEIVRDGKAMNLTYEATEQPAISPPRSDGEPAQVRKANGRSRHRNRPVG